MALPSLLSVGQMITAALINQIIGQLSPMDSGIQSVTVGTVNTPGSAAVTFAAGKFSATPVISVNIIAQHPEYYTVSYGGASSTGMTIYVTRISASGSNPVSVGWTAAQTQ